MKYFKIKVSLQEASDKLYRILYIPKDLNLEKFIHIVITLFKADHYKTFFYWDGINDVFGPKELQRFFKEMHYYDYEQYNVYDVLSVNPLIHIVYDTEDEIPYNLTLKLDLKNCLDIPIDLPGIVTKAKGDCLFINNHKGLINYLCKNDKDINNFYSDGKFLGNDYDFYPRFDYHLINNALLLGVNIIPKWSKINLSDVLFKSAKDMQYEQEYSIEDDEEIDDRDISILDDFNSDIDGRS